MRGPADAPLALVYADFECPYCAAEAAKLGRIRVRLAFRHFPVRTSHPRAWPAACAAESAALQGRFWEMHDLLYHRQKALEDDDLRAYAAQVGLDVERFERDRVADAVLRRVARDLSSGIASGQVLGTPTLFIDGAVHTGGYDLASLIDALSSDH